MLTNASIEDNVTKQIESICETIPNLKDRVPSNGNLFQEIASSLIEDDHQVINTVRTIAVRTTSQPVLQDRLARGSMPQEIVEQMTPSKSVSALSMNKTIPTTLKSIYEVISQP